MLTHIVTSIVDDPDAVSVDTTRERGRVRLDVRVGPGDLGRVIGRRGRTAQSIRTVVAPPPPATRPTSTSSSSTERRVGVTRPASLLEIGHIRRPTACAARSHVELGTDRVERVGAGSPLVRPRRVGSPCRRRAPPRPLAGTFEGVDDRSAAQRFTNAPIYAEPIDDPDELWVHELIGPTVVEVDGRGPGPMRRGGRQPGRRPARSSSRGPLVPVVFVVAHTPTASSSSTRPEGLFDD